MFWPKRRILEKTRCICWNLSVISIRIVPNTAASLLTLCLRMEIRCNLLNIGHIHDRRGSVLQAFYVLDSYGLEISKLWSLGYNVPLIAFFIFFFILNGLFNLFFAFNHSINLSRPSTMFAQLFFHLESFDFVQNTNSILSCDFNVFLANILHKFS